MNDFRTLPLSRGRVALVSPEDFPFDLEAYGMVAAYFDLEAYRCPEQAEKFNALASDARNHQLEILRGQPVPEPLRTFVELCAVCGKPCEFSGWDVCVACQSQRPYPHSNVLGAGPNVSHRRGINYTTWFFAICAAVALAVWIGGKL